ncbi:SurA N-terminal domain-containing protein [Patescibacteria group bacterium]|nr:SurA N-terminal domain-containing protein [Patescibacteria group bacterium]
MQENKDTNDTSSTSTDTNPTPAPAPETSSVASSGPEAVGTTDTPTVEVVTEPTSTTATADEVVPTTDTTAVPAEVVADTATNTPSGDSLKKQMIKQYGIATVIILIIGAGLVYALEQQGRINTGLFDKVSALVNPVPAAAIVNGTKISKADYDKNLTQLQTGATAQGIDVNNESIQSEIKQQAIDVLINTELLRQAAYSEGALVTDEQIEARYQEIVTSIGGEEQLAAKMVELGITEPALRKDIEGEILIQGHLSKAVDISKVTISEQELTDAYTQISGTAATGVTVPPLEEIKTQLEAQLKTNKEQELVNAYITELREAATIEILI